MDSTQSKPKKALKLKAKEFQIFDPLAALVPTPASIASIAPIAPIAGDNNASQAPKKKALKLKNDNNTALPTNNENTTSQTVNKVEQNPQVNDVQKPAAQPTQSVEAPPKVIDAPPKVVEAPPKAVEVVPKVQQSPVKESKAPSKQIANFELISYYLDKDVEYFVEEDDRKTFDRRILLFMNRKYEANTGKDGNFNRGSIKNMTTKPNGYQNNRGYNNKQQPYNNGTNIPGDIGQIQRNDSKKMTAPVLAKNQSQNTTIKRTEEDKDVSELKNRIKLQSAQFLEKMRSDKLDNFKKQISDIRLELNILTPTNFEIIKKKLYTLAMSDELLCEYVVEGIIEKARTQKTYSLVYADLCKFMIDQSKTQYGVKDHPEFEKSKIFKNHLYTNIQQTFEGEKDVYNNKMSFAKQKNLSELNTPEEKNQYFAEKKKREMLNVKFIGNLFLNKSMSYQILRICCSELLSRFVKGYCEVTDQQRENQEVEEAHFEDHIEALISLFEQTGQKMEEKHKEEKKKSEQNNALKKQDTNFFINGLIQSMEVRQQGSKDYEQLTFDDYFTVLEWLKKNKKVSPRIYSLIINLVERKNENWKDRISTQTGPVSLSNLHKQHEEEMKQSQIELAKYEQEQKDSKQQGRGYNNKRNTVKYEEKNKKQNKDNAQTNGKYDEKNGITRAKEFWGYLDSQVKLQEDYLVSHCINDFKQFKEECDPVTYGEIVIKTVYDCNKLHKENRIQVAKEALLFIKPEEFSKAFNERLNKSKDESSDFPLFLEFLSELFVHFFQQGIVKFNNLKIAYKEGYDEDDQEDLNFVYMTFFEECITLLKSDASFNVSNFIKQQIDPVLLDKDARYNNWVKDMSK